VRTSTAVWTHKGTDRPSDISLRPCALCHHLPQVYDAELAGCRNRRQSPGQARPRCIAKSTIRRWESECQAAQIRSKRPITMLRALSGPCRIRGHAAPHRLGK
jgi:hypothetical protein